MSYILEALKRSQAERELGRVPTLQGAGLFIDEPPPPRRSRWALLSVGLAASAVLIALYAALRPPPPPPVAMLTPRAAGVSQSPTTPLHQAAPVAAVSSADQSPPAGPAVALPAVGAGGTPPPAVTAARPSLPPIAAGPPAGDAGAPVPGVPVGEVPLSEAPPPKGAPRTPTPVPGAASAPPERSAEAVDAEMEQELRRQLEAEEGATPDSEQWIDAARPQEPVPTPVPPDLIADIESFKQQARQAGSKDLSKGRFGAPGTTPESAVVAPPRYTGDVTKLRLTREQQAALPSFLMTVHVFDTDQARRFVLINGLTYHEGDKTREGLVVEQIVAGGAVLSHQGSPFFVQR